MLSVFSICIPGLTRRMAAKLFQTNPAQTRSTSVSAIWAMTSALRRRTDCVRTSPCSHRATNRSHRSRSRARPDKDRRAVRSQRDRAGGTEHRKVERNLVTARNPVARQACPEQIQSPTPNQHAADAAEGDQQKRLDQMFARRSRSGSLRARAEWRPRVAASEARTNCKPATFAQVIRSTSSAAPTTSSKPCAKSPHHLLAAAGSRGNSSPYKTSDRSARSDSRSLPVPRSPSPGDTPGFTAPDDSPEAGIRDKVFAAFVRKWPPQLRVIERLLEAGAASRR